MNYVCRLPPGTYLHAKFFDVIPIFITKYINDSNNNNYGPRNENDSDQWTTVKTNQFGTQTFQQWMKFLQNINDHHPELCRTEQYKHEEKGKQVNKQRVS